MSDDVYSNFRVNCGGAVQATIRVAYEEKRKMARFNGRRPLFVLRLSTGILWLVAFAGVYGAYLLAKGF